jgi:hypothetical protein
MTVKNQVTLMYDPSVVAVQRNFRGFAFGNYKAELAQILYEGSLWGLE